MKKPLMARIACILCCLLLLCACGKAEPEPTPPAEPVWKPVEEPAEEAAPVSEQALQAAKALHELGLFFGTGTDADGNPVYELSRTPNRHEAAAMLVRLLGKEADAKAAEWTAPFTDVADWAKPYVGYAYENDIVFGTSATTYGGSEHTTAAQYITCMLRVLGYSSETDFRWDAPWELSDAIGMTDGQYDAETAAFTRGDLAILSYSALSCERKDGVTLYDFLTAENAAGEKNPEENTNENTKAIETPFLTLYIDSIIADHLSVVHHTEQPYTLSFYAILDRKPEQPVFDILLGDGADGNLGIIETECGNVPASLTIHAFTPDESWTQDEINTVHAMQEAANDLIGQLTFCQATPETPEVDSPADTAIDTPFCTLYYPETWNDSLQVEQTEETNYYVRFRAALNGNPPVLLFTLIFGGDEGEQLGAVQDDRGEYVPVNLVIENLENCSCSDAEAAILYEMQEAVNSMIAQMPLA